MVNGGIKRHRTVALCSAQSVSAELQEIQGLSCHGIAFTEYTQDKGKSSTAAYATHP